MQTQRYFWSSLLSTRTGNTSAFARYPLHNSNAKFPANLNGGINIWRYISTLYKLGVVPYNVSIWTLVMSKLLSRLSLKDRVFTVLVTSSNPSSSWLLKMSIRLLRNEKGSWAHMCPAIVLGIATGDTPVSYWPFSFSLFSVTVQKSLRTSDWSSFLLSVYQSIFFWCWLSSICSDILSLASCQWHGLVSSKVG